MTPRAHDLPGAGFRGDQPAESGLPFRAPDLQVHVDDVVVGDRDAPEPVVHDECAELVARLVVPDDSRLAGCDCRAERARGVGAAKHGAPAWPVAPAVLADAHLVDRLARPKRNVPVAAGERSAERVRDGLFDDEAAVLRDLHRYLRLRQRERLRLGDPREDERRERYYDEGATRSEASMHRRPGELAAPPVLPVRPARS